MDARSAGLHKTGTVTYGLAAVAVVGSLGVAGLAWSASTPAASSGTTPGSTDNSNNNSNNSGTVTNDGGTSPNNWGNFPNPGGVNGSSQGGAHARSNGS